MTNISNRSPVTLEIDRTIWQKIIDTAKELEVTERRLVEETLSHYVYRRERNKRDEEEAKIAMRQMALEDEVKEKERRVPRRDVNKDDSIKGNED
jgi:hypothetical protein